MVPRPLILRALRPFVEAVKALPEYTPDSAPITLTVGECRTAAILAATIEQGAHMTDLKGTESLLLKWGTIKGWDVNTEASRAALRKWHEDPVSMSAMAQRNTPRQIEAICDVIDAIDGEITNDWSGETMTKAEAKKYVREYRT